MRTMSMAASLLAVVAGWGVSGCAGTKTETVSAASVARLPPGETLEIDLTRPGTVFEFPDPDTDLGRVTVRTAAGVGTFADLLKASETSLAGGLLLGTPADMRDHLPTSTGGAVGFDCGVFCKCNDTNDCIDLILSGKCSDEFWCSSETSACFCVAKR